MAGRSYCIARWERGGKYLPPAWRGREETEGKAAVGDEEGAGGGTSPSSTRKRSGGAGNGVSSGAGGSNGRGARGALRAARALDPQGVYQTRSLTRRHLARRRRAVSYSVILGLGLAGGVWALGQSRQPRLPDWPASRVLELDMEVASLAPVPPLKNTGTTSAAGATSAVGSVVAAGRDGRLAWVEASGRVRMWSNGFPVRAQPLVVGQTVLIGGEDGVLRAFDLGTRLARWQSAGPHPISCRPLRLPASRRAASPEATAVTAAPAASTSAGSEPSASASTLAPAVDTAVETVVVADDGGEVRALRLKDGGAVWKASLGAPCGSGLSALEVEAGRTLIFVPLLPGAGRRGGVAALEARSGRVVWRYPSDRRVFAGMAAPPVARFMDGRPRLFCADDAGVVGALDAATGQSSASPKLRALTPNTAAPTSQWKVFLSSGPPPIVSKAPVANSGSGTDAPGARGRRASALRERPVSNTNPNFNVQAGADGGDGTGNHDEVLISVRIEPRWAPTSRGALLVVGGNDGGVRALDARSGRAVWSQSVGGAPLALLSGPPARDDAARTPTVVAVTPTGVWRWKAVDGTPLSHSAWGAEFGHATAAVVNGPRLFVAGRDVAVFDFVAAP